MWRNDEANVFWNVIGRESTESESGFRLLRLIVEQSVSVATVVYPTASHRHHSRGFFVLFYFRLQRKEEMTTEWQFSNQV